MDFHDNRVYKGLWKAGQFHGKGEYYDGEHRIYKGFWVKGIKHGVMTEENLETKVIE